MIEELKLLIEAVSGLPTLVVWVCAMFFVYKVVVVGSVYGVIRFVTTKVCSLFNNQDKIKVVQIGKTLFVDSPAEQYFLDQMARLKKDGLSYIHQSDIERLEKAIDKLYEKEQL